MAQVQTVPQTNPMNRIAVLLYGIVAYTVFFVSFAYAVGFTGNLVVPKGIDTGVAGPLVPSLIINAILLGLFAVQHSVMARPGFKRWWTQFVPQPIERSTYVLLSSLLLLLLYWQWRPMPTMIWDVQNPIGAGLLWALFAVGWLTVFFSTFMINHFDLFGLRQVYLHLRGYDYTPLTFTAAALYRVVRHPIMLGFIIAFWATPQMSLGHLVFAMATTLYILLGIQLEERDLMTYHGEEYKAYRKQVGMLMPRGQGK